MEEQAYLTTLRREKKAFESLIKEKATMVVPEDREAGEEREGGKASDSAVASSNSRREGGVQEIKVGCLHVVTFGQRKIITGSTSSDRRHERVPECSSKSSSQKRN